MTGLNDRTESFLNKFKHDEELMFKINVHTSKLFGLWAAEQLGLDGAEADSYAATVVDADFEEPGFDDVLRKVRADFDGKEGLNIDDEDLRRQLEKMVHQAEADILGDTIL